MLRYKGRRIDSEKKKSPKKVKTWDDLVLESVEKEKIVKEKLENLAKQVFLVDNMS